MGFPIYHGYEDDGDNRNIELPFSKVNHVKFTTHQQYVWEKVLLSADLGFQNNHREEWSLFHTHYGTQSPPEQDPDKELAFELNTFSTSVRLRLFGFSFGSIRSVGMFNINEMRSPVMPFCYRNIIVFLPACSGLPLIVPTILFLFREGYAMTTVRFIFRLMKTIIWRLI